jgi:hypothetical protein
MSNNPLLIQSLATDHVAKLRLHGVSGSKAHRALTPKALGTIRTRSGWLLVGLGLRLVMPNGRATNRLANPAGH